MFTQRFVSLLFLLFSLSSSLASNDLSPDPVVEKLDRGEKLLSLNDKDAVEEIVAQLEVLGPNVKDRQVRIRYLQFLGGYENKMGNLDASFRHYKMALKLTKEDEKLQKAISFLGLAYYYTNIDTNQEILYAKKSLENAMLANNSEWIVYSSRWLSFIYKKKGDLQSAKKYLNYCSYGSPEDKGCQLAAILEQITNKNYKEGVKSLYNFILEDQLLEEEITIYASLNLIGLYLQAGGLDDAEKLLNSLLNTNKIKRETTRADFYHHKGLIFSARNDYEKALEHYKKAFHTTTSESIKGELIWEVFLIASKKKDSKNIKPIFDKIDFTKTHWQSKTGVLVNHLMNLESGNLRQIKGSCQWILNHLKKEREHLNPKKALKICEFILNQNRYRLSEKDLLYVARTATQISNAKKINQVSLTNEFFNAQNTVFKEKLINNTKLLNETESKLTSLEVRNKQYLKVGIWTFIALVVLCSMFLKTIVDYRKIKELSSNLACSNNTLKKLSSEYKNMLMTLSHHVKKPIIHLHYAFNEIQQRTAGIQDRQLNSLVSQVSKSSEELASRVQIVLAHIRNTLDNDFERETQKVTLIDVVKNRILFYQDYFDEHKINTKIIIDDKLKVSANPETLAIVLDNLLENIKKYSSKNEEISITAYERSERVTLEIKNRMRERVEAHFKANDATPKLAKDSFGLGVKIIRSLCNTMKIGFQLEKDNAFFVTRLTF